jgi:hypothetical protein
MQKTFFGDGIFSIPIPDSPIMEVTSIIDREYRIERFCLDADVIPEAVAPFLVAGRV